MFSKIVSCQGGRFNENAIQISVTKYPINLDYNQMQEISTLKQVSYQYHRTSGTDIKKSNKMPLDIEGLQDANKSFWNCYHVNACPLLMEGKLYVCTIAPNIIHFNRKFNTHMDIEKDDYLDIYSINDNSSLLSFICTPKPFCRFCKTTERSFGHTWERSKQEMSEWT